MINLKDFKPGQMTINLSNDKLDNAQFIMFVLLEKYKIKSLGEDVSASTATTAISNKNIVSKLFKNKQGLSIGTLSCLYGEFEFFLNGVPKIFTPTGQSVSSSDELKKYLIGEKDYSTLHFETKAYIQVVNHTHPNNYYGVFYSLGDAIKIASENDLVKTGEVTS